MSSLKSARLHDHFAELTDPRRREVTYPLINVVSIAVCAVICGADDFVAIAKFGETKREWLARFLDLKDGIPSHDRFNAIFAAIKPAEFEKCLLSWITTLHEITDGQVIAIGTPRELKARSGDKTRIEVRLAKPEAESDLKGLEGVSDCRTVDGMYVLQCQRPPQAIVSLVKHLESQGNELVGLEIATPSLEDVFIELTGRRLRD